MIVILTILGVVGLTAVGLVLAMLVIATDDRVYSRSLRLDALAQVAVVMFSTIIVLSIILFIAGVWDVLHLQNHK